MLAREQAERFKQWIEEHKGILYKVARANTNCQEDQDELFQEIAFQVWRSIPSFQGRSKVSTWVYRVALNTAMVWRRTGAKSRAIQKVPYDIELIKSPTSDPSQELAHREMVEWLYEEIRKLPVDERSLALLFLEDFKYREIADFFGITVNHVGVKIARLKKHLETSYARRKHESR